MVYFGRRKKLAEANKGRKNVVRKPIDTNSVHEVKPESEPKVFKVTPKKEKKTSGGSK